MKLVSALVGLAALGGVALSSAAASAMPVAIPAQAAQASNVQQAAYVCNAWGHCWHQPTYATTATVTTIRIIMAAGVGTIAGMAPLAPLAITTAAGDTIVYR